MTEQFNIPPEQQVFINPTQMQGFIESVNMLNDAINRLSGGGSISNPAFKSAYREHLGEEELGTDVAGKNIQQKWAAQKEMKRLIDKSVTERVGELKKMFGESITVGSKKYSAEEAAEKMGEQGDLNQQIQKVIVDKMKEVVDKNPSKFTSIMDAVQEAGLKQLRFGELPPQQILEGAGQLLQRYANYRMGQGKGVSGGPGLIYRISGGRLGSATGAMGTTGMLGELGGALGSAGKILGPATIIAEEGKKIYDKTMGNYRELTASGQLTGQGTMAGFAAKYTDPFKIWNPFGRIGWGTAQEIVQNTREQGFTGPIAGQMEQGLATVVSNLGIQVGQATDFFTQSMREGGMSVGQVTQEMSKFHDATYNLNMNINDYTEQIMTATSTLRDLGAGTTAPALAQQITTALPRAYRGPEGTQFLTGAFEKSRGVLAAMVGHGANVLSITSERYQKPAWSALDTLLDREVQRAKDQGYTTPNDIANYLSQTSPFFGGTDVNMLQQYINQVHRGRGITAQLKLAHASQAYHQRLAHIQNRKVGYWQLTDEELKQKNLQKVYVAYPDMKKHTTHYEEGAGYYVVGYKNMTSGKYHSLKDFTTTTGPYYTRGKYSHGINDPEHTDQTLHSGPGGIGPYNAAAAAKVKREFLIAVKNSGFLTSEQLAKLAKAQPFEVSSTLNQILQSQRGPKIGVNTQVGTITIELAKNAQGLLTLVRERQHGVANGSIQNNHTNR